MDEHDDDLEVSPAAETGGQNDLTHVAAALASGLEKIAAALEVGLREMAAAIAKPRRRSARRRRRSVARSLGALRA